MISKKQFIVDLKEMLGTNDQIEILTDLLEITEWDSFSRIAFIAMAENKYGVTIKPFSIAEAVLVEDLYEAVKDSLRGKD